MAEYIIAFSILTLSLAMLISILLLCVLLWSMDGIDLSVTVDIKESSVDLDTMDKLGQEAIEANRSDEEQEEKDASIGDNKTPSDMPVNEALER